MESLFNCCYFNWQAQLYKKTSRAPPPLVPLPNSLPLDNSSAPVNQISQDQLQNACIESLPELPCEVEIKEMTVDTNLNDQIAACEPASKKPKWLETYSTGMRTATNTVPTFDMGEEQAFSKAEYQARKEEKRTSILEQALTGNLMLNNMTKNNSTVGHRERLHTKSMLTSEWWCTPCNRYFKWVLQIRNTARPVCQFSRWPAWIDFRSRESLIRHMQMLCPREFTCKRCSMSFESVELLARHEAEIHLEVRLGSVENLNDCDQCDRQFLNWNMLRQHRLCYHLAELSEFLDGDTRCSYCNRWVWGYISFVDFSTNIAFTLCLQFDMFERIHVHSDFSLLYELIKTTCSCIKRTTTWYYHRDHFLQSLHIHQRNEREKLKG